MAERRLLALFAHPDDESFGCGGTLARYTAEGARVTLVCATRGEAGEIADPSLASPDFLGEVRERELREAAEVLGIAELHLLGYRDGELDQVDSGEAVERIVWLLRLVRPQVVLTFGPDGMYGHPDHVVVSRWATESFRRAREGGPDAGRDHTEAEESLAPAPVAQVAPWAMGGPTDRVTQARGEGLQRLYYVTRPRSTFRAMRERAAARGVDLAIGGVRELRRLGVPDDQITGCLDVQPYIARKLDAIRRHRTQLPPGGILDIFDPKELEAFMGAECFVRAFPPLASGAPYETDLFEGLG